jgi:hypothetical protein
LVKITPEYYHLLGYHTLNQVELSELLKKFTSIIRVDGGRIFLLSNGMFYQVTCCHISEESNFTVTSVRA